MGGEHSDDFNEITDMEPSYDQKEYMARRNTALQNQRRETLQMKNVREQRASNEIQRHHRTVRLSNTKQFCTMFFCRCCANKKAQNLYDFGYRALQWDLDLIRLIKNTKNSTTLSRCTFLTNQKRYEHMTHSRDNVLDLDERYTGNKISVQVSD